MISERTVVGMQAAKRQGRHVGRPRKLTPHKLDHARQLIAEGKRRKRGCGATRRRCGDAAAGASGMISSIFSSTEVLSAWAAMAQALAGIALVFLTGWLACLTRTLANETRLTREVGERADVQCAVEPHEEYVLVMELVIANVGKAAATNVRVTVEPEALQIGSEQHKPLILSWASMLPNTRFRSTLGTFQNMHTKIVKAHITYTDKFGLHDYLFEQDISGWEGFRQTSHNPHYAFAASLKKIEQTLDGWNYGSRRLSVDTFNRADRNEERQKQQEQLEESRRVRHPDSDGTPSA